MIEQNFENLILLQIMVTINLDNILIINFKRNFYFPYY